MGEKSPKRRELKKKKKEVTSSVGSTSIKSVISQPELITKPPKK